MLVDETDQHRVKSVRSIVRAASSSDGAPGAGTKYGERSICRVNHGIECLCFVSGTGPSSNLVPNVQCGYPSWDDEFEEGIEAPAC